MDKIIQTIIIVAIAFISIKAVKMISKKIDKKNQIHIAFFKSVIQAIILIIAIGLIFSQFDLFSNISSTILTSSTLIVAVLAFSMEEGITNFVHGLIISLCKPFNIGDRLTLPNQNLTGTVESITLRHTVIKNVTNGAHVLIPNSVIDKEIIQNAVYEKTTHLNFIDISVSRDSDIELARDIFKRVIEEDKRSIDKNVYVYVRDIDNTAVYLRASVSTNTIEENFLACSEIRRTLIKEFKKADIKQPYDLCKYL
jgi:small-conductance mechanosensitive channel